MKLGINTYTFMWAIGFEGAQPEKPLTALGLLEKARCLGVRVLQTGPNLPFEELPEAELEQFVHTARDWGIELEVGMRGLELERIQRQVALCQRMGARLLRSVPELGGETPNPAQLVSALRAALPVLEDAGIYLGLENGKIPCRQLSAALDEVGSPQVGVVLDMVNSLAVPEGWREVTEVLAPYTMCLHFKDFVMRRAWHMMGFICEGRPAGQGQLEAAWLLQTLRAARYDFNVILELWTPEQNTLAETIALEDAWAEESVIYLKEFI